MDWIQTLATAPKMVVGTSDVKLEGWGDLASLYGRVSRRLVDGLTIQSRRHIFWPRPWRASSALTGRLAELHFVSDAVLFERDYGFTCPDDECDVVHAPFGRGLKAGSLFEGPLRLCGMSLCQAPRWVGNALTDSGFLLPDHHHRFVVGVTDAGTCIVGAY